MAPTPKSTSGRLGATTNLLHGFIYFSPEATAAYDSLGLAADQHYFASRAAPMGPVGAEVVIATFFNFNPDIVRRALPAAWEVATPSAVQSARLRAAQAVFGPACAALSDEDLVVAIDVAAAMVAGVGDAGRPLAAANRAVELPDEPAGRLWQLLTVLREWRGDAHVAVLAAAPLTAVEALVLHAATGVVPTDVLRATRAWPDSDWNEAVEALADRGLVRADGSFTDEGRDFRADIETATDRAAQPLVDAVGDEAANQLCDLLRPVRSALVEAGAFDIARSVRDARPSTPS